MKITDIKVVRFRTTHHKDAFGNRVRDREKYLAKRPVQCVAPGRRFGHFFVDYICLQVISLIFQCIMLLADLLLEVEKAAILIPLIFLPVLYFLLWPLLYFICENTWQRTPGKFLTKCVVIDDYGNKPTVQQIVLRSIIRLVPFEPFSCLGDSSRGWHDRWSDTWVVTTKELAELKRLMEEQSKKEQPGPINS